MLKRYQKALIPAINELYNNIQTMRICELKHSDALDVEIPNDLRYEFSKLSEAVYGNIGLKKIQDRLHGIANIQECISYEEMYALTLAGFFTIAIFFYKNKRNKYLKCWRSTLFHKKSSLIGRLFCYICTKISHSQTSVWQTRVRISLLFLASHSG